MKINRGINHKQLWFDSMIGMTWGFIASLVVGTIIGLFGLYSDSNIFVTIKNVMTYITGFAIGVGVGIKIKLKPLQILAVGLAAFIAGQSTFHPGFSKGSISWESEIGVSTFMKAPGDVFGAWIVSMVIVYLFEILVWESFLDILLVPMVGVAIGIVSGFSITFLTSTVIVFIEWVLSHTVDKSHLAAIFIAPFIGLIMGLALSLPTSSAAIALMIHIHGDAATAAIAGTAAQMISFGIMTYMATGSISKALGVGFGTSMLQMHNFLKRPRLLVIPAIASMAAALLGVLALPLEFPVGAHGTVTSGMGSCALYGQIFTLQDNGWGNIHAWLNVVLVQLIFPTALTMGLTSVAFQKRWIKRNWLEISHG